MALWLFGGRLAFEFYARFIGKNVPIYMPDPTWANHLPMAKDAGLAQIGRAHV